MTDCPCGSKLNYDACCGMYISGKALAPTAEALMRARYSAYVVHNIDFIEKTHSFDGEVDEKSREETRKWAEESKWLGLKILKTKDGGPNDTEGLVEFIARYERHGRREEHHENAAFKKVNGAWLFEEGLVSSGTVVRTEAKVGRNDPCPCGSGKKYKQCCGRA